MLVGNFLCGFFTFEINVRYFAFVRSVDAFRDSWFRFDGCLCLLMVGETWMMPTLGLGSAGLSGANLLKLLRLLRLARLVRLVRVLVILYVFGILFKTELQHVMPETFGSILIS